MLKQAVRGHNRGRPEAFFPFFTFFHFFTFVFTFFTFFVFLEKGGGHGGMQRKTGADRSESQSNWRGGGRPRKNSRCATKTMFQNRVYSSVDSKKKFTFQSHAIP